MPQSTAGALVRTCGRNGHGQRRDGPSTVLAFGGSCRRLRRIVGQVPQTSGVWRPTEAAPDVAPAEDAALLLRPPVAQADAPAAQRQPHRQLRLSTSSSSTSATPATDHGPARARPPPARRPTDGPHRRVLPSRPARRQSHVRSPHPGRHTTAAEHMPEKHRRMGEWTPDRFIGWAEKIGPDTAALITAVLDARRHPQQAYRSCIGLQRLAKCYGDALFGSPPTAATVRQIAEQLDVRCAGAKPSSAYDTNSVPQSRPPGGSGAPPRSRQPSLASNTPSSPTPAIGSAGTGVMGVPDDSSDQALSPPALLARTRTVYSMPLVSPVSVADGVSTVCCRDSAYGRRPDLHCTG